MYIIHRVGSVIIFSTGAAILALFSVTCVIALYLAHKFKLSARVRSEFNDITMFYEISGTNLISLLF